MVCRILRNSATNYRRTVILARRDDANIHLFLYQTGERDVATVEKYCIRRRIPLSGIHRTCNHPFLLQPQNSLLTIYALFEKIVAQHPEMKEPCCITLCQLFLKKDESLQKKAANFISKYGDVSSSNLQETLQSYQPEMFQSVHAILSSFKPQPTEEPHEPDASVGETVHICRKTTLFPSPPTKKISCSSLVVCSTWRKVGR